MAEDEDKVRLKDAARQVWLVKAPPRVARMWDQVLKSDAADDALLGRVRVHANADGTEVERISFHLADQVAQAGAAAAGGSVSSGNDFNLKIMEDKRPPDQKEAPARIFSTGHGGIEMEGVVEHTFFMQPMKSGDYDNAVKGRVARESIRTRVTKEMDSFELMRLQGQQKTRVVKMDPRAAGKDQAGDDDDAEGASKRRKLGEGLPDASDDDIRNTIFLLFQRKDEDGNVREGYPGTELARDAIATLNRQGKATTSAKVQAELRKLCDHSTKSGGFVLKPEYRT